MTSETLNYYVLTNISMKTKTIHNKNVFVIEILFIEIILIKKYSKFLMSKFPDSQIFRFSDSQIFKSQKNNLKIYRFEISKNK